MLQPHAAWPRSLSSASPPHSGAHPAAPAGCLCLKIRLNGVLAEGWSLGDENDRNVQCQFVPLQQVRTAPVNDRVGGFASCKISSVFLGRSAGTPGCRRASLENLLILPFRVVKKTKTKGDLCRGSGGGARAHPWVSLLRHH